MALKRQMNLDPVFRIVRQQDLSGFKLTESVGKQHGIVRAHSHEQRHLTFILAGSCYETYMGRKQTLFSLTVTHFHPGESHALEVVSVEPVRSFDIELQREWLDRLLERPISATALFEMRDKSITWLMATSALLIS